MNGIYICLFVFYPSVLASSEFVYSRSWLNQCKTCDKRACWVPTAQSTCEYEGEVAALLTSADEKETNPRSAGAVNIDVDNIIYDIVENAPFTEYKDCIPFISQHTDCSKENICTGCKQCSCSLHGNWRCILVQQCRPGLGPAIDHQTVSTAIEKMNYEIPAPRYKRSLQNKTLNLAPFWKIIESFHNSDGEKGSSSIDNLNTEKTVSTTYATEDFSVQTESTTEDDAINFDSENLAFEEVLKNIAVEDKTKQDRFLNESMMDNLKHEDINNSYFDLANIFNELGDNNKNYTNDIEDSVTELAIDLLASVTSNPNEWIDEKLFLNKTTLDQEIKTLLSKSELYNYQNYSAYLPPNGTVNDIDTIPNHDVDKREILNLSKTTDNINNTIPTETIKAELQNEVFEPLNNLIKEKQKEIEELTFIKDEITKYLSSVKAVNKTNNDTNQTKVESHFAIYTIEINPEPTNLKDIFYDTRDLNKYLQKVKTDIYTTLNDVEILKKLSPQYYTEDVKSIEDALKIYALKEDAYENYISQSRRTAVSHDTEDLISNLKLLLTKVDQGVSVNKSLSLNAKKIITRILSHKCFEKAENFVKTELYSNLTEELQAIGKDWERLSNNIAKSSPTELLHNMKLAHFSLSKDILKLTDALMLIKFARSRRMPILDNFNGKDVVSKIAQTFNKAHSTIVKAISENKNLIKNNGRPSFLEKVKNFFHFSIKRKFLNFFEVKPNAVKDSLDKGINNSYNKKKNQEKIVDGHIRSKRSFGIYHKRRPDQTKRILPKYLRKRILAAKKSIKSRTKHTKVQKNRTNKATNVIVPKPVADVITNRSKTV